MYYSLINVMDGTSRWFTWIVVAVIVIGGGWFVLSRPAPANVGTGPIKIGLISPLTGEAAVYGEAVKSGMALAIKEINAAGGIGGRQIQAIYEDGKCNGKDAASAAQKLVGIDGVKYIVGGGCSGETFAAYPIASAQKVIMISPSSSAPGLAQLGPYFLRNNPNDNIPGMVLADYVSKSYKTVAVIAEQTPYAQGIKEVFVAQAKKDGLNIVSTEDYDSAITDFRSLLTRVNNAKPEVIFIDSQAGAGFVRIATQARQLGIKSLFVGAAFNDAATINSPAAKGAVLAVPPGLASEGKGPKFIADYKTVYGVDSSYPFFSGAAYDDVYLLKQAIESVGDDTTKVQEYLHSMPSFTGVIGTYHFDQNGDMVGVNSILQQVKDGKVMNI